MVLPRLLLVVVPASGRGDVGVRGTLGRGDVGGEIDVGESRRSSRSSFRRNLAAVAPALCAAPHDLLAHQSGSIARSSRRLHAGLGDRVASQRFPAVAEQFFSSE